MGVAIVKKTNFFAGPDCRKIPISGGVGDFVNPPKFHIYVSGRGVMRSHCGQCGPVWGCFSMLSDDP